MDFALTEEQIMFRDMAHKFAEQEILPYIKDYEREEKFWRSVVDKARAVGLGPPSSLKSTAASGSAKPRWPLSRKSSAGEATASRTTSSEGLCSREALF